VFNVKIKVRKSKTFKTIKRKKENQLSFGDVMINDE
jgi:hypothetical protein